MPLTSMGFAKRLIIQAEEGGIPMCNFCVVSGPVLREPEFKVLEEKQPVATFTVGLWMEWERTGWVRVVCLGALARVALKDLQIGSRVVVSGFLEPRLWQTNDGIHHEEDQLTALELDLVK
jgi:single-stranded DNA-binding protein